MLTPTLLSLRDCCGIAQWIIIIGFAPIASFGGLYDFPFCFFSGYEEASEPHFVIH